MATCGPRNGGPSQIRQVGFQVLLVIFVIHVWRQKVVRLAIGRTMALAQRRQYKLLKLVRVSIQRTMPR